jgi:hypothetical protein
MNEIKKKEYSSKDPRYLGLCEIFHPYMHGFNKNSDPMILGQFLVCCSKNFAIDSIDSDLYSDSDYLSEFDSEINSDSDSELEIEIEDFSPTSVSYVEFYNSAPPIQNLLQPYFTNYAIINEFEYLNILKSQMLKIYQTKQIFIDNLQHSLIKNYENIIKMPYYIKPEIFQKVYTKSDHCFAIIKTFWIRIVQRSWKRVYKERIRIKGLRMRPNSIIYYQTTNKWPDDCLYMPGIRHMILLPNV